MPQDKFHIKTKYIKCCNSERNSHIAFHSLTAYQILISKNKNYDMYLFCKRKFKCSAITSYAVFMTNVWTEKTYYEVSYRQFNSTTQ